MSNNSPEGGVEKFGESTGQTAWEKTMESVEPFDKASAENARRNAITTSPETPSPTPVPDAPPLPPTTPPDISLTPMDTLSTSSESAKKKRSHEHIPSRSAKFLENQALARREGQRIVGDSKRDDVFLGEIEQRVAKGENISDILKNTSASSVWLHAGEFMDSGASPEEVFDNMPKSARWLSIDELVSHGYDINKLADKLDDTVIWLQADKFVKYGADIDRLKQRLSFSDSYLKSLINKGELFGDTNGVNENPEDMVPWAEPPTPVPEDTNTGGTRNDSQRPGAIEEAVRRITQEESNSKD